MEIGQIKTICFNKLINYFVSYNHSEFFQCKKEAVEKLTSINNKYAISVRLFLSQK